LLTWQVLQKIPSFVLVGSILLGGIWWITNRRREVQLREREERTISEASAHDLPYHRASPPESRSSDAP
jgi:hypothetical protein